MPVVRLKGLNRVRTRLKDGREVIYWYAWKGGPRLSGKPGTPEFIAAYNEAIASLKRQPKDNLAGLVQRYRGSPEYTGLGDSTRRQWARWLDVIGQEEGALAIGGLPLRLLDDRRVKADILAWRDQWATTPRKADYGMQVLSRVLSWGMERGELALNAAAGATQLYVNDRADQIWTEDEISRFVAAASSPEVGFIIRLACLTGLRREDLVTLTWSQVTDVAIVKPTGKSRRSGKPKTAVIPLLTETRALLQEIETANRARRARLVARAEARRRPPPPEALTVLVNTRGQPWSVNGAEHQVIDTKAKAAPAIGKHLHDARGTFGTRLRKGGLTAAEIADILGWEETRVQRLLATYVDREAIVRHIADRISANESTPVSPK